MASKSWNWSTKSRTPNSNHRCQRCTILIHFAIQLFAWACCSWRKDTDGSVLEAPECTLIPIVTYIPATDFCGVQDVRRQLEDGSAVTSFDVKYLEVQFAIHIFNAWLVQWTPTQRLRSIRDSVEMASSMERPGYVLLPHRKSVVQFGKTEIDQRAAVLLAFSQSSQLCIVRGHWPCLTVLSTRANLKTAKSTVSQSAHMIWEEVLQKMFFNPEITWTQFFLGSIGLHHPLCLKVHIRKWRSVRRRVQRGTFQSWIESDMMSLPLSPSFRHPLPCLPFQWTQDMKDGKGRLICDGSTLAEATCATCATGALWGVIREFNNGSSSIALNIGLHEIGPCLIMSKLVKTTFMVLQW